MKAIAVLSVIFLSSFASAQQLQTSSTSLVSPALEAICADGVTAHPKWPGFWHLDRPQFARSQDHLFATMHLRPTPAGEFAVVKVKLDDPKNFVEVTRFQEDIRDLEFHDGEIWALFKNKIVSLRASDGVQTSETMTTWDSVIADEDAAQAFTWAGNKLVIAHGTKGALIYDHAARSITQSTGLGLIDGGHISKAIDVTTVNDNEVLFAVEAVTIAKEPPFTFNGLMFMTMNGQTRRFGYDRKANGSLSNALVKVVGDTVLINNWGILQTAKISAMRATSRITTDWTPIKFDVNGSQQPGELLGDMMIDGQQIIACAQTQYQNLDTLKVIRKGVIYTGNPVF